MTNSIRLPAMETREARYWNINGKGIAIVAFIHHTVDWAAYIGADDGHSEQECIDWTTQKGAKLSAKDARHFFPNIELPYRE